jgi:hypothetical protein
VEVGIALYVHDRVVRPFVGDVLVVILIYAFVRALFEPKNAALLAIGVLIFAYLIEIGQFFSLVSFLGLEKYALARVVLGATFDWMDLIAYSVGFLIILMVDVWPIWEGRKLQDVRQ